MVITCEHAVNRVPHEFAYLFADREDLLSSHRAYDPGTRELARHLACRLSASCHEAEITRLLVDCNRSPGHRKFFHHELSPAERELVFSQYYRPYRDAAQQEMAAIIASGRAVLHLSIHSFTPILDGEERNSDFSLLYDPRRSGEKNFCISWLANLNEIAPDLRLRRNYPYRGVADGFATALRKIYGPEDYLGIELEVNQNQVVGKNWPELQKKIADSLARTLAA